MIHYEYTNQEGTFMKAIDLTGEYCNGMKILGLKGKSKSGDNLWYFQCVCGKTHYASATHLNRGKVKSCGCIKNDLIGKANSTHGKNGEPTYAVWKTMKSRCNNPNNKKYKRYGARGIKVCSEWEKSFLSFHEWAMSNGYAKGLSIDRIENNGNYEPKNCRWVNNGIQSRNRSNNRIIEYKGVSKCLSEWSRLTGLGHKTISSRIKRGWTIEEALTTSTNKTKVKKMEITEENTQI